MGSLYELGLILGYLADGCGMRMKLLEKLNMGG